MWEECIPHVEFAYNRVVHGTTKMSPFEVVYGFNPLTPLDLLPMPNSSLLKHKDEKDKVDFLKKMHKQVKLQIEKKKMKGVTPRFPNNVNNTYKSEYST